MNKTVIKSIDMTIYDETLSNGLRVILIPFENRKNYSIEYTTRFGSNNIEFIPNDKKESVKVPYGIAHFLEHKMFEQEDGEDPFSFFSKYGSDANAATGYKSTSYTVDGTNNIEENLDYLLTYVNSPYFTDENVEKEKNIIIEEVNMYKDEPEGKLFEESNKAIFKKHPMRVDIGGTPKSVRSITKEQLYGCYNSFYQPSNMFIVIGGNFDVESVLNVIKNNKALNNRVICDIAKNVQIKEPLNVNTKEKELNINNIMIPKVIYTLKVSLKDIYLKERYKYKIYANILASLIYGNSSDFREEMLNKQLFTIFSTSVDIVDDFMLIEFVIESNKPKDIVEYVKSYFGNTEIDDDGVERQKRVYISNLVFGSDNVENVVNSTVDHIIDYGDLVLDKIEFIRSINKEDIIEFKKRINIDNSSLVIGYPKNN